MRISTYGGSSINSRELIDFFASTIGDDDICSFRPVGFAISTTGSTSEDNIRPDSSLT